jgi:hypothetical protein
LTLSAFGCQSQRDEVEALAHVSRDDRLDRSGT